jgi:Uma2 family endonuclease
MAIRNPSINLPLENGDRLSQPEFHRRYAAMPENCRAELVEGVVYVSSPVRIELHSEPVASIVGWLMTYATATPGVRVATDGTIIVNEHNEVQPDAMAWLPPSAGGRAIHRPDDYLSGAPELVAEIAASSASYDATAKREMYRRAGIQEYILWRTRERAFDWWHLRGDRYLAANADADGLIASRVLPGLTLDRAALQAGDLARVIEVQRGVLGSEAHAAFVRQLQQDR